MLTAETAEIKSPSKKPTPPGPRGLPIFGCLNGLLRNPMSFWSAIATRYGGIVRIRLRGRHVYLISDPKLLYELLVTKRANYRKNTRYKAAVETFGAGLLLTEGEAWKRQRLLTQATFKPDYVAAQVPTMSALARSFLARWDDIADGSKPRDVDRDFLKLSQRLAGHYLMGPDFATIETQFGAAAEAIKDHWPLPPRGLLHLLRPRQKRRERLLEQAVAEIDECLFAFLARRRSCDFADSGVLGAIMLGSRAQNDAFDDRSLRDQLLTLFFAGHETTATSLSWIHYLLSTNRHVRLRVQAEVRDTLGTTLEPTAENIERLSYTGQVINETLRMYSPIHSISRVALENDTIGGYAVPKGATIYVSLHAVHRQPSLWPKPDHFDPERFAPSATACLERFAFIPFAAGHRNCIGATMAMSELKVVTALIAQRFELDHDPAHRVVPFAGTTMRPKFGMRMFIKRLNA